MLLTGYLWRPVNLCLVIVQTVTGPKVTGKKVTEEKSQKKSHRTESHRKKVKTGCVGRGWDRGRGQGVGV